MPEMPTSDFHEKETVPHYRVEVDKSGCETCSRGTQYVVVSGFGDDEIAGSVSYEDREHADELCELQNEAYDKGYAALRARVKELEALVGEDKLALWSRLKNEEAKAINRETAGCKACRTKIAELEADAHTVAHIRQVLAKIREGKAAGAHLSDSEVAGQVRMLMRDQLDHEMVCVMARDRIIALSDAVFQSDAALSEASRQLAEMTLERDAARIQETRNYLASPAMRTFVDLKHSQAGTVLAMLGDGAISRGKCCEALAQLAHGVPFDEIPLPEEKGRHFGLDEIPAEVVEKLEAEIAELRVKLEAAEHCQYRAELALTLSRNQLVALRKEASNDEMPELCEEISGVISIIDAAIAGEKP